MTRPQQRRSNRGRMLAACMGWLLLPLLHAAESPALDTPQKRSLFQTYMLFLQIATDDYAVRTGEPRPVVDLVGLEGQARENLIALSKAALEEDASFQRNRMTDMCSREKSIHSLEQLADEYVAYSTDLVTNQQKIASRVLEKLDQPSRMKLTAWRDSQLSFRIVKGPDDEHEAILGYAGSASQLLQKFCNALKPEK